MKKIYLSFLSAVVGAALFSSLNAGDCSCNPCECNPCNCGDRDLFAELFLTPPQETFCGKPIFCVKECSDPVCGEWLPERPPLFRPFIADPRQICSSVGWRFDDCVLARNVIPVSYGDLVPIYRWFNVWPWCGELEIDAEGAVWAVFDPLHESSPLIDADYYIGFPISYSIGDWQFRLRGYHISTHIGDEYLLNHPNFKRLNPSAEYIDFFVSWYMSPAIRLYSGLGVVVGADESFPQKRFFADLGFELRFFEFGFLNQCQYLYGTPFFAAHLRTKGDYGRHVDMTYALGYEFGKLYGLEHRLRFQAEYHDGYSPDGQFSRFPTNYFQVRMTYGY